MTAPLDPINTTIERIGLDGSHLELPIRLGWMDFLEAQEREEGVTYLKGPCAFIVHRTRVWLKDLHARAQEMVSAGVSAQAVVTYLEFVREGHLEAAKAHRENALRLAMEDNDREPA